MNNYDLPILKLDQILPKIGIDVSKHPAMHKTDSIDYIILLKGDVTLILDEDEIDLKPFDTIVQRGTNHAWRNNGNEPALFIAVLIDSEIDA